MQLATFVRLRPFAFHTTSAANLPRIADTKVVESTRCLFAKAGYPGDPRLRSRRLDNLGLNIDSHRVIVRDQRPVAGGAIEFEDGWDLPRFIAHLNSHVFFWPGTNAGPGRYGRSHFDRYARDGEALVVLRIPTVALFAANEPQQPLFSRCNSGSARMQQGRRVLRGSATLRAADAFDEPAREVKELVFKERAVLPALTEWASSFGGSWSPIGVLVPAAAEPRHPVLPSRELKK